MTRLLPVLLLLASPAFAQEVPTSARAVQPLLIGTEAPDGELVDATGTPHRLHDLLGRTRTVLVFYRGHW